MIKTIMNYKGNTILIQNIDIRNNRYLSVEDDRELKFIRSLTILIYHYFLI